MLSNKWSNKKTKWYLLVFMCPFKLPILGPFSFWPAHWLVHEPGWSYSKARKKWKSYWTNRSWDGGGGQRRVCEERKRYETHCLGQGCRCQGSKITNSWAEGWGVTKQAHSSWISNLVAHGLEKGWANQVYFNPYWILFGSVGESGSEDFPNKWLTSWSPGQAEALKIK